MSSGSIGLSLVLMAVGAILTWAIDSSVQVSGLDLQVVGVILMIVGAIGVVFSLLFLASFAPFGGRGPERHDRV